MVLDAARRLVVIFVSVVGGVVLVSLVFSVFAGTNTSRSIAVGLYAAGCALLVGSFVAGTRGPLRAQSADGEPSGLLRARSIRRAAADERSDALKLSLLLFAFGLSVIVLGAVADPAHRMF